ncbi:MAG: hypothetical protein IH899_02460 [Planctomycetes bacterium]|nr:hypothetical protein [Planctomycetota bacterium]
MRMSSGDALEKVAGYLVPTLCVGTFFADALRPVSSATRSVETGVPTQSVGTRITHPITSD